MLSKENIAYIYPLSPLQEGIYFHSLLNSQSNAYLIQASYEVQGEIDVAVMEKSFHELLQRHDVLRTVFVQKNAHRTLQVVLKHREPDFVFKDFSAGPAGAQLQEAYRQEDKNRRFDLGKDVLMRVSVLKLDARRYEIIWTYHHIIMDGWCIPVLAGEFYNIYYRLLQGRPPQLPPVTPYRDYIKWLEKQDKDQAGNFWAGYLDGYDTAAVVPPTMPADKHAPYQVASHGFGFSRSDTQALVQLATRHQVTMNVLIQAIWGVLLGRYNGVRDVVFGTVVSGRSTELEDVGSMIGLFINTIPVRIGYGEGDTFTDLLHRAKRNALACGAHDCYPLVEIQANTPLRQHLLDHILVFYNYPVEKQLEDLEAGEGQGGFAISKASVAEYDSYHFNFNIVLEDTLSFHLDYNGNVFHESFIRGIARDFTALSEQILADATVAIDALQLAPAGNPDPGVASPAAAPSPAREGVAIHTLFERQAALHPEANAVVAGNAVLTFGQLNQKANQLAHYLRETGGVGPGDRVAVLLDRSERMVIAILGILKAGAAFLPIDPNEPGDRRDFVLADSNAKVLLTESAFLFRVERFTGTLFAMDIQLDRLTTSGANPAGTRPPGSLAYVIYT
ncbi:MAG: AMP-binding protein, partial [Cytophagales bacterium]|nr:AMP-binding protein [Cytophagales bacterium]